MLHLIVKGLREKKGISIVLIIATYPLLHDISFFLSPSPKPDDFMSRHWFKQLHPVRQAAEQEAVHVV